MLVRELLAHGHEARGREVAEEYLRRHADSGDKPPSIWDAYMVEIARGVQAAEAYSRRVLALGGRDTIGAIVNLAYLAAIRGDLAEAGRWEARLARFQPPEGGSTSRGRAEIAVGKGAYDRAVEILREESDRYFFALPIQHDPHFAPLRTYPPARDLLWSPR